MMQIGATGTSAHDPLGEQRAQGLGWIRYEVIAYAGVILLALALRLANLDTVPMGDAEANRAMATWHVLFPDTPSTALTPDSPFVFWTQAMGMGFVQQGEWGARLGGVLAGLGLTLLPLAFRARLGAGFAFLWSVLLAVSPITLGASRTHEPMLWATLCVLGSLWFAWKYWDTRVIHNALTAIALAGITAFLGGSGAFIWVGVLLVAIILTLFWTVFRAPLELETPSTTLFNDIQQAIRVIPIGWAVLAIVASVFLGATGFMLYPAGLAMVGQGLSDSLSGWWTPYNDLVAFPLVVLGLYDVGIVVLGGVGYVFLTQQGVNRFVDRLALVSALVSLIVLVFYRGATPAFALWVSVPMTWLVARAIDELLVDRDEFSWVYGSGYLTEPSPWVKWLLALLAVGLVTGLGFHLQAVGRGFLALPSESPLAEIVTRAFNEPALFGFRIGIIWAILIVLFGVVGTLLVISIWGNYATLQGIGLGLFIYVAVSGMGGGWNALVVQAERPQQLWHSSTISADAMLLRKTLQEVAWRDTKGFPDIPITVVMDETNQLEDGGMLAWLLRDFKKTRFTPSLEDAKRAQILLIEASLESPDLGGSYVGQSFRLREYWSFNTLAPLDSVAWVTQRRVRVAEHPNDTLILWLRVDVYDALPIDQRQN